MVHWLYVFRSCSPFAWNDMPFLYIKSRRQLRCQGRRESMGLSTHSWRQCQKNRSEDAPCRIEVSRPLHEVMTLSARTHTHAHMTKTRFSFGVFAVYLQVFLKHSVDHGSISRHFARSMPNPFLPSRTMLLDERMGKFLCAYGIGKCHDPCPATRSTPGTCRGCKGSARLEIDMGSG